MSIVLVTGGSGFIGGFCLRQLLGEGYRVRTTVRSATQAARVYAALGEKTGKLACIEADLTAEAGWREAAAGCEFVLHVASPFPAKAPRTAQELIVPAVEGTLRVLRAARSAGVKRVVMTSSFASIGYGAPQRAASFDESDWTNLDAQVTPYARSKTLAERAAWEFVAKNGAPLELTVINPVLVLGPLLYPAVPTSVQLIQRMLSGGVPACPKIWFGVVDVRDVAALHILAMRHPRAGGERFLAAAGDFVSVQQVAEILRAGIGSAARKVPHLQMPDWLVRVAALYNPEIRLLIPELGKRKIAVNDKALRLLGWTARPKEECILATARSLFAHGFAPMG